MLKFLLDEHVPPAYRTQLLHHEPQLTVWVIGDVGAPAKGTLDPQILRWCETNDFVLVTNNRKTMPQHLKAHLAQGRHVPGILTIDFSVPMGRLLETLILMAGASFDDEFRDRVVYVTPV